MTVNICSKDDFFDQIRFFVASAKEYHHYLEWETDETTVIRKANGSDPPSTYSMKHPVDVDSSKFYDAADDVHRALNRMWFSVNPAKSISMRAFLTVADGGYEYGSTLHLYKSGVVDPTPFAMVGPPMNPNCILSATVATEATVSWEPPEKRGTDVQEYWIYQYKNSEWDEEKQNPIPTVAISGELKYAAKDLQPGATYKWIVLGVCMLPVGGCDDIEAPDTETEKVNFTSKGYTPTLKIPSKYCSLEVMLFFRPPVIRDLS